MKVFKKVVRGIAFVLCRERKMIDEDVMKFVSQCLKLVNQGKIHSIVHRYCDSCARESKNSVMLATLPSFLENINFIIYIRTCHLYTTFYSFITFPIPLLGIERKN